MLPVRCLAQAKTGGALLHTARHSRDVLLLFRRKQLAWDAVTLFGALIGLALLLAATVALGVFVQWRQGRPRRHIPHEVVQPARLGADSLGRTATLLQFSTDLCSRCPGVHRTLESVASGRDGVRHLDIDVTRRPDIAKHFHIRRHPQPSSSTTTARADPLRRRAQSATCSNSNSTA